MATSRQRIRYPDNVDSMSAMALLEFLRRPISVDEYNQMAEAGILDPDERVELLDGDLIVVPPHGTPHSSTVLRMGHTITLRLSAVALVSIQLPIIVSDCSEPEPDIAVLRLRDDFYAAGIARPPDVLAIVEVADTSLGVDSVKKLRIYAEAGVPEYWIVDVKRGALIVHREPNGVGDDAVRTAYRGARIAFAAFPDETFAVEELIG